MKTIIVGLLALLLTACGSFKTQVQTEEGSSLHLVGNPEQAVLVLDNTTTVDLNKTLSFDLNGKQVTKIVVPQGQHRVTITRNGTLLVDRSIYIGEGQAFEIVLP